MCIPALLAIPAAIGTAVGNTGAALGGLFAASAPAAAAAAATPAAASILAEGASISAFAPAASFSLASVFTPNVLAGLSVGLAATSAGLGFYGQHQQASAQSAMAKQVAASAAGSYRAQSAFLDQQLIQRRSQSEQQLEIQGIQAAQIKSRARASAAEAGVSGVSLDSVLGDLSAQQSREQSATLYNYNIARADNYNQKLSAYSGMVDRYNSTPMGVFPSLLSPIISTAGAALDAAGRYGYVDRLTRNPT